MSPITNKPKSLEWNPGISADKNTRIPICYQVLKLASCYSKCVQALSSLASAGSILNMQNLLAFTLVFIFSILGCCELSIETIFEEIV